MQHYSVGKGTDSGAVERFGAWCPADAEMEHTTDVVSPVHGERTDQLRHDCGTITINRGRSEKALIYQTAHKNQFCVN